MGKFLVNESSKTNENCQSTKKPVPIEKDCIYSEDIPSDIIFPEQLNRYLRDQIHSLTLENGGLRRDLEETQEELTAMKEKLSKPIQPVQTGRVAEMAEYKIAQLSKRLREQNAEMESLRTKTKEAEAKLKGFQEKSNEEEMTMTSENTTSLNEFAEKDKQIKLLTEKLQSSNAKLCDFRNQYQSLKQEMKLAQRVIENEIGEKCSIQDLAKENGNWRGRAQQIISLQNKVQMLQEQLSNSNGSTTENPASTILRQIERERRANYEETSKQLNQKTIQMEEMRKKLEASKARNKILENEILQVKSRINALTEKGFRDEQLITSLTNQINAFDDRGKAQMQCFVKMQENQSKIQEELEFERTKCEQLQKALADRESRIRRMEEQLDELRKSHRNKSREVMGDENGEKSFDLMTEKSTMTSPKKSSNTKIVESERMRLLELLAIVNRRLDESRQSQNQAESQLRKERYKNAKLETKIARLELEKVGAMKTGRGSYSHGINRIIDSPNPGEMDVSAKQHIEYLEEERLALKTRIETLQMEREEDLKALTSIAELKESDDCQRQSERRVKPNKKNIYASPTSSVRSLLNQRQSSLSSEDLISSFERLIAQ